MNWLFYWNKILGEATLQVQRPAGVLALKPPQYTQVQPTFPWLWPLIKGQRKMEYYSLASWNVTTPFLTNKKRLMTILSPWISQKEAQNEKHSFICLGILMKSKISIHIELCFSYFWTFYCSNNWSFNNNRRPPSIYYSKCQGLIFQTSV